MTARENMVQITPKLILQIAYYLPESYESAKRKTIKESGISQALIEFDSEL
jgi:histone H3/H4